MTERKAWTRDELILAINLYCKTPFGKIHYRNPEIITLAEKLGRSPGSVAYKLANFAHIDPSLERKGASNVSKLDRKVWDEFFSNWEEMAFESERLLAKVTGKVLVDEKPVAEEEFFGEGKTKTSTVKVRVNQQFFRKMVLSAYDNICCITGIAVPELLIASHIVPWSRDKKNRLNPRNGLCLNALHDRAFDKGFITINKEWRIIVSPYLKRSKKFVKNLDFILSYENQKIELPRRFIPQQLFLEQHRSTIFRQG
jgi:putative restriction endonuclease